MMIKILTILTSIMKKNRMKRNKTFIREISNIIFLINNLYKKKTVHTNLLIIIFKNIQLQLFFKLLQLEKQRKIHLQSNVLMICGEFFSNQI